MPQDYVVPDVLSGESIDVETEIKRSRFLACITRVSSRAEALSFQQDLKLRYPDASHHCLAFVAGPPEGSTSVGFDDDGEPGGTAGKPMLNVLQHKKLGEIAAVVVRYFGGIKLGAGGLVRAYGTSVQAACDVLPVRQRVAMKQAAVFIDYALEQPVRYQIEASGGKVEDCCYTDRVELQVSLPVSALERFTTGTTEACKGRIKIVWQE